MMIGTVFFLAMAAPILAAEYPTTTPYDKETTYKPYTQEPTYETRPPTTYDPSYAPPRYNPTHAPPKYNPTHAPTDYTTDYTPTDYKTDYPPTDYKTDYKTDYPPTDYKTDYKTDYPPTDYKTDYKTDYPPTDYTTDYKTDYPPTDYKTDYAKTDYNPTKYEPGYGHQPSYRNDYQGPYNSQYDLYTHYPVPSTRNIRSEIVIAAAKVSDVLRTDRVYENYLDTVNKKVNETSTFRERFNTILLQQLVDSVNAQDKKIAHYKYQLNDLSGLTGDVRDLINTVNALARVLSKIRARQANIAATIEQLRTANGAEDLSIVAVEDQTDGNDQVLEIINATIESNRARNAIFLTDLHQVVKIINEERAVVITVVLTARNSSVYVKFETPFDKTPQLAYSITGLEMVDVNDYSYGNKQGPSYGNKQEPSYGNKQGPSYGNKQGPSYGNKQEPSYGNKQEPSYGNKQEPSYGNKQESIFPRVTATADTKGATVTLVDKSVGWEIEYVRVRLFAFYVNNDQVPTKSY